MDPYAVYPMLAILWLVVSVIGFIDICARPKKRILYAAHGKTTPRIIVTLVLATASYARTHAPITVYILLVSLLFIAITGFITQRHRRLVMNHR